MTRDEMIKLAIKAGFTTAHDVWPEHFQRFAALAAAHERENCAKLLEDFEQFGDTRDCIAAIRARGQS